MVAEGQAVLVNAAGLHARPAVRLTQAAKGFAARVEFALAADGPWIDAKSPVQVMRARAPKGAVLWLRCTGSDADAALGAITALIAAGFGEG